MRSEGLLRFFSWMRLIAAVVLCAEGVGLSEAPAKEFWFEAQELEQGVFAAGETEIWLPPAPISHPHT